MLVLWGVLAVVFAVGLVVAIGLFFNEYYDDFEKGTYYGKHRATRHRPVQAGHHW